MHRPSICNFHKEVVHTVSEDNQIGEISTDLSGQLLTWRQIQRERHKMVPHAVRIRDAMLKDTNTLYEIGINEEGFAVSSLTKFYERDDLKNWIANRGGDILLIAEAEKEVVGFLFCRVVRNRWAMLENMVVSPTKRKQGIGTVLIEECFRRLRAKGVTYVAGIVKEGNQNAEFFLRNSFSVGNKFVWIERHLTEGTERQREQ